MRATMHAGSSSDLDSAASVTAAAGAPSARLVTLARLRAATCPSVDIAPARADALTAILPPVPAWFWEEANTRRAANDTRPDRLDVMARRRETRHFRVDGLTVLLADDARGAGVLDGGALGGTAAVAPCGH